MNTVMKEEYHPKLADKGWKAMRGILDREMPVEPRRRGFVWWPLAALLLLFSGSALLWVGLQPAPAIQQPAQKAAPTLPADHQPVAISTPAQEDTLLHSDHTGENPQVANTTAGNDRASDIQKLSTKPEVRSGSGGNRPIVKSVTPSGNTPEQFAKLPITPLFAGQSEGTTAVSRVESGETAVSGTRNVSLAGDPATPPPAGTVPESTPVSSETFAAATEYLHQLSSPASAHLTAPGPKHSITPQTPVIEPFKQKHDRFAIGPSVGIGTERFRSANALSAGLTFDWQPLRRWGLRSGVQYSRQQMSTVNQPVASIDAYQYVTTTLDTRLFVRNNSLSGNPLAAVGTAADYAGKSVVVPISNLYRVDVPLLLYGELYQKLRIYAGVSLSRLIGVGSYDQVLGYNNKVFQVQNQEAVNMLVEAKIERNTAFYQFGIGRRFGKHWDLMLQYEGSFKSDALSATETQSLDNTTPQPTSNYYDKSGFNSINARSFENSAFQLFNLKAAFLF